MKAIRTELSLTPDEFDSYTVGVDTEVTFCLKEFRVCLFCNCVYFSRPSLSLTKAKLFTGHFQAVSMWYFWFEYCTVSSRGSVVKANLGSNLSGTPMSGNRKSVRPKLLPCVSKSPALVPGLLVDMSESLNKGVSNIKLGHIVLWNLYHIVIDAYPMSGTWLDTVELVVISI